MNVSKNKILRDRRGKSSGRNNIILDGVNVEEVECYNLNILCQGLLGMEK